MQNAIPRRRAVVALLAMLALATAAAPALATRDSGSQQPQVHYLCPPIC